MENMKPERDGFRYRDKPSGDVVEIKVGYDIGGYNYFMGKQNRRGVYVYVTPVTIETRDDMSIRSTVVALFGDVKTSGAKVFALALNRKSAKKVQEIAERIDSHVVRWAASFRTDPHGTMREVYDFFNSDQPAVASK